MADARLREDAGEPAVRFLSERYGCGVLRLNGGDTNGAYLLRTAPPRAAKRIRLHSRRPELPPPLSRLPEALVLRAASGTGLAPELLDTVLSGPEEGFLIQSFCPGENGQTLLDTGDGERVYGLLGAALPRLQRISPPGGLPVFGRELILPEYVPAGLRSRAEEAMSALPPGGCLVHGDFGPHNALVRPEGLTLIDFEWAENGPPAGDPAWLCWFTRLHYPDRADRLLQAFWERFSCPDGRSFTREELTCCAVRAVCRILVRAADEPEEIRNEWIRRLRWTLDDFPELCL